eukprot:3085914-Amphidinium_carterae.1
MSGHPCNEKRLSRVLKARATQLVDREKYFNPYASPERSPKAAQKRYMLQLYICAQNSLLQNSDPTILWLEVSSTQRRATF